MKYIISFFLILISIPAFAMNLSDVNCINDYYSISSNYLLVIPTIGVDSSIEKPFGRAVEDYKKFLSQFCSVKTVTDKEFVKSPEFENHVVIIIGTEHTNEFLRAHQQELLAKSTSSRNLRIGKKLWSGEKTGAILLNPFGENLGLVFYIPDLCSMEFVSRVNHGPTDFVVFNLFGNMAVGYFSKEDSWSIDQQSLEEFIAEEELVYCFSSAKDSLLMPGDILEAVNKTSLRLSNLDSFLNDLPKEPFQLKIRRNGVFKFLTMTQKDFKNFYYGTCPINPPLFSKKEVGAEFSRIAELVKNSYVDPFDRLKTQEFEKHFSEFLVLPELAKLSYPEVYSRLASFASRFDDGHMYCPLSNAFLNSYFLKKGTKVFPFQPIIDDGNLFVPENSFGLPKGGMIKKINQIPAEKALKRVSMLLSGDTFANKLSECSEKSFSDFFFLAYGEMPGFQIEVCFAGKNETYNVEALPFYQVENQVRENRKPYVFSNLSPNLFLLQIDSFGGEDDYEKCLTEAFGILKKHPDANLVIDLRKNSGGNTSFLVTLLKNLISGDYRIFAAARTRRSKLAESNGVSFNGNSEYGQRVEYKIERIYTGSDAPFKGGVFVCIGPKTFSTAFDCAVALKEFRQAILVGQPTGGKLIQSGDHSRVNLFKRGINFSIPYKDYINVFNGNESYAKVPVDAVLTPDLNSSLTIADIVGKVDPCIKAIEEYLKSKKDFNSAHQKKNPN